MMRIGLGYDLHRLETGRLLVLGGVTIPHGKGLAGHSDADALCHAATDLPVNNGRIDDTSTIVGNHVAQ